MLKLWRRHTPKCVHRDRGRDYMKCRCPLWVDGELGGQRYRASIKTCDHQRALKRVAELERSGDEKPRKPLQDAIQAFLASNSDLATGTLRNHRRTLAFLSVFALEARIETLDQVQLESIDQFRAFRPISPLTWSKELAVLRGFFRFCVDREWIADNVARRAKMPKNLKPKPKEPYTPGEIIQILHAADTFGQGAYERLRARAMILLMRYSGLRVSDVALFRRDCIGDSHFCVNSEKTGKLVRLPMQTALREAIDALPKPRGNDAEWKYLFWSGNGTKESAIRDVTRTLNAVFKKSGVVGAHAHRFRHTLATEILTIGGTAEDAANILGNTANLIRKHYEQWTVARQDRILSLMQVVHGGTLLAQTQTEDSKLLI